MQNKKSIIDKIKLFSIIFFALISSTSILALDNCKGVMNPNEVPCLLLLQFNQTPLVCTDYSISMYNESDFLYSQNMSNYSPFMCYATYNISSLGTFNFQYSTGDTGTIKMEAGYMNIVTYIFLFGMVVMFMIMMHTFKKQEGVSISMGAISGGLCFLISAMLFTGFDLIEGVILFIDANYWIAIITIILGMYNVLMAYNLYGFRKYNKSDEEALYG